ncbi:hypothetical protein ACFWPK_33840 [Nocardia sp. NPDC058519]|uniref:hypothetical protein n=1 Tax=Nocardia sp. NPDC058519 TaxID=3346535 RepID=UPI003667CD06
MTGPDPYTPPPPSQIRLGLWGPPGSGKTTYLAALNLAALRSKLPGNWTMNGADPTASEFITESTKQLVELKTFPAATERHRSMMFKFTGERAVAAPPAPKPTWRFRGVPAPVQVPSVERDQFYLDVLDVPGVDFEHESRTDRLDDDLLDLEYSDDGPIDAIDSADEYDAPGGNREKLLDHLQQCQGIVYLFDPDRDARQGDSFSYFHPVLEQLAARVMESSYTGSRLPHRVAVCITKFDDPTVYKAAYVGGFSSRDANPPFAPVVRNGQAREFFHRLCRSNHSNADLVYEGLTKYFDDKNIEFFVTSAVGFHAPDGLFRSQDPFNVKRDPVDGRARIRGKVHPINVLEPLIWLHESLRDPR